MSSDSEVGDALAVWELGAGVTALAFTRDGSALGFALGDGVLALCDPLRRDPPRRVPVHDGAILALAADGAEAAFVTGGDDGALCRVAADANVAQLASWPGKWVEHVLAPAGAPFRAAALGKSVHLLDRAGKDAPVVLEHASTVGGIALNAKAKRLAVAHYGGVSLWWTQGGQQKPKLLAWRGSHIDVSWSPDGAYVVSSMQEMELHGWRLKDAADMRMSGYPSKVRSLAWSAQPFYLATSGANRIVCWPFSGAGPMGRPPIELGHGRDEVIGAVAVHPRGDLVAAGFADGALEFARISERTSAFAKPPGGGRMVALAFSPDGRRVAFGTEDGLAGVLNLQ